MIFLYTDGAQHHFMNAESYEQIEVSENIIADTKIWLKEQQTYQVLLWNQQPINVIPENNMTFTVIDCEPNIKGNSQSGVMKSAIIETGAKIKVPLFIKVNDIIKIDTRNQTYIERINS